MDAEHQANADRIRTEGDKLDPEAEAREAIARSWERDGECARLALMDAQAWATLAMVRELRLSRDRADDDRPRWSAAPAR